MVFQVLPLVKDFDQNADHIIASVYQQYGNCFENNNPDVGFSNIHGAIERI